MHVMGHSLSNFLGSIAAWLCLAPVAFTLQPLSLPTTLARAPEPTHYIASLSLILIWIIGGIFLVAGGLLAFTPSRCRTRESYPLTGPAQVYRITEIDVAWTAIPVLVLVFFLV